jgi:hypothetical protein
MTSTRFQIVCRSVLICAGSAGRNTDRSRRARWVGVVCGTDWLKATATLETAARLRPLEVHNNVFAWPIARVFLELNGHVLQGAPADALALVAASREDRITVPQIAAQLRKWATA